MTGCIVTLDVAVPSPRALDKARYFGDEAASSGKQPEDKENYRLERVQDLVRGRFAWLLLFFAGLMLAAAVVEAFEEVLRQHVELSYFVPLLIGHGGNTGSQSNATVIRALALGHLKPSDWPRVMLKECAAGALMGGALGGAILACSLLWSGLSVEVGLTVAIALPAVSLLANLLGGLLPLLAAKHGHNPAVTSAPLMTVCVDVLGLGIYFLTAQWVMGL